MNSSSHESMRSFLPLSNFSFIPSSERRKTLGITSQLLVCLNFEKKNDLTRVIRGMHGPTCLDQRDSRLAVELVFFSTPIPTLDTKRRASCTTVDGGKREKWTRRVFRWILIGNMKPMLREENELQRGSVKGITGVQPVNRNEIHDVVVVDGGRGGKNGRNGISPFPFLLLPFIFKFSLFDDRKKLEIIDGSWLNLQ